jgi:hypothetical protein
MFERFLLWSQLACASWHREIVCVRQLATSSSACTLYAALKVTHRPSTAPLNYSSCTLYIYAQVSRAYNMLLVHYYTKRTCVSTQYTPARFFNSDLMRGLALGDPPPLEVAKLALAAAIAPAPLPVLLLMLLLRRLLPLRGACRCCCY